MSRVEVMQAASGAAAVKFLEITRVLSKKPNILVCIFEGEDECYYGCRLSATFGDNEWHGINTGGRKVVLDLLNKLSNHPIYKKSRAAYFIDRDYEHWYENPDPRCVYVTPGYSVENFYATKICLGHILSAEFKVTEFNELSDEYNIAISLFDSRFEELFGVLKSFNVWGKAKSIMTRDNKGLVKLYLNDATAEKLATLNLNSVTPIYNAKDIKSLFKKNDIDEFDSDAILEAHNFYNEQGNCDHYRGKQQLAFFMKFLKHLIDDYLNGGGVVFKSKQKLKLRFNENSFLSDISQYAETPPCLRQFLASLQ